MTEVVLKVNTKQSIGKKKGSREINVSFSGSAVDVGSSRPMKHRCRNHARNGGDGGPHFPSVASCPRTTLSGREMVQYLSAELEACQRIGQFR